MMSDVAEIDVSADREAIAAIVRTFFEAFTSGPGCASRVEALRALFLPEAVIVRAGGDEPAVYDVEGFLAPREAILADGTLEGFREWELSGRTELFGDIAHHFCSYAKEGIQAGQPIAGRGMKTMQLVRTAAGWRISGVAWDDEREGLSIDSD